MLFRQLSVKADFYEVTYKVMHYNVPLKRRINSIFLFIFRPKILVFSGVPAHRQPLVDFANLITKKLSLLICAHVEENAQVNQGRL